MKSPFILSLLMIATLCASSAFASLAVECVYQGKKLKLTGMELGELPVMENDEKPLKMDKDTDWTLSIGKVKFKGSISASKPKDSYSVQSITVSPADSHNILAKEFVFDISKCEDEGAILGVRPLHGFAGGLITQKINCDCAVD